MVLYALTIIEIVIALVRLPVIREKWKIVGRSGRTGRNRRLSAGSEG
jgi:hypothetical protein